MHGETTNHSSAQRRLLPCAAFALLLLSAQLCPAAAPPSNEATAAKLRDQATAGQSIAYPFVSELTTRFGPRPAGSAAEQQAAAWAASRFKALGFENVRVEPFPITAWTRGTEKAEITAPSLQPLAAVALGASPPTPAQGVEGEVMIFPTLEDLLAAPKGSLNGKIAMVANRMVRMQNGTGYATAVAARYAASEAAQRGAIAFLLRSVGTDSHRTPHTGSTRYADGRVPLPVFALSNPDADQIERLAVLKQAVRVHLFSSAAYIPNAQSQNVIAEIRGRERPQEIILLGAHLDSWDQGTGAVDDAAGAAIVTAAAKLIADLPQHPRRTIRVVLFGSEEMVQPVAPYGAFGGHAYVRAHQPELASHQLAGESDAGADRIYSLLLPKGLLETEFAKITQRVLAPLGILIAKTPPEEAGTDVGPTIATGVPPFLLAQDMSREFDLHHTADDTLDKVDRQQLEQNVAAWAAFIWLAAESDVEFRTMDGGKAAKD
jgi:acetylornithine deacetylase/succinyl-diaminopimelate desuccinylase-like protein